MTKSCRKSCTWNSQFFIPLIFVLVVKQGFDFQVSSGSVCVVCVHNPCTRNSSGAARSSRSRWIKYRLLWNKFYVVCVCMTSGVVNCSVFFFKTWKYMKTIFVICYLTGSCTSITIAKVCESIRSVSSRRNVIDVHLAYDIFSVTSPE